MKTIGLFFFALAPIVASAADGCSAVDPSVVSRLADLMPIAAVDAAVGCPGRVANQQIDFDGSLVIGKVYADVSAEKIRAGITQHHAVFVVFKNGLLASAVAAINGSMGLVKSSGYPLVSCTGKSPFMVCTP